MSLTPNYTDMGLASAMGPELKKVVEQHLLADLRNYGITGMAIKFDWSQSCIEGRDSGYLGGYLDNFSGITLFDANDNIIGDGWMDFVHEPDFFLVFWDNLEFLDPKFTGGKPAFGIPPHIWEQIPFYFKDKYEKERMKG